MECADVTTLIPMRGYNSAVTSSLTEIRRSELSIEAVIIDDGIPEEHRVFLVDRFPEVSIIPNSGVGIVDALNTGLANSQGRYIARQDADDLAAVGRFDCQLENLLLIDAEFGWTGYEVAVRGEVLERHPGRPSRINGPGNPFCAGTLMARRDVLRSIGGWRREAILCEDFDLHVRLLSSQSRWAFLEGVWYKYNVGGSSSHVRHGVEMAWYAEQVPSGVYRRWPVSMNQRVGEMRSRASWAKQFAAGGFFLEAMEALRGSIPARRS